MGAPLFISKGNLVKDFFIYLILVAVSWLSGAAGMVFHYNRKIEKIRMDAIDHSMERYKKGYDAGASHARQMKAISTIDAREPKSHLVNDRRPIDPTDKNRYYKDK